METTYRERFDFVVKNLDKIGDKLITICKGNTNKSSAICNTFIGYNIDIDLIKGLSIHQIDILYDLLTS